MPYVECLDICDALLPESGVIDSNGYFCGPSVVLSGDLVADHLNADGNALVLAVAENAYSAAHLGYDATQEELAWASEVLDEYSDRNPMVMTHAHRAPSINDGRGGSFSHDGAELDQSLLQQHDNVFLVLSGHEHGVTIEVRKDVGTYGNNIVELLADYQFYEVSAEELGLTGIDDRNPDDMLRFGASFFRMLQIDVDASEMAIDTYSPLLENFGATEYDDRERYNGTEDDTRVPIQLETCRQTSFTTDQVLVTTPTGEVIGEAIAASGWPAEVTWSGLSEGETYAWYVVSRDADSGDDLAPGEVHQMGVFTATAAGTDDVAPELTIPEAATITAGEAFDPMAGVSATDNTDGDLTDAVQVIGAVDTDTPGTYVLTYVVEDSNGNQASATRAVTVTEAADDSTPNEDQPDGDDTGQDTDGDDTAAGADPAGGTDTTGDTDDGDGASKDDSVSGSTIDVEDRDGFLANTGANGTVLLVLGGLLSVVAGVTAWQISRRRSAMH